MPTTLNEFFWYIFVFILGICGALIGVIYSSFDKRLQDHDTRIRNLELTITHQLDQIMEKLGVK